MRKYNTIRVLQVVTNMNAGGIENMLMNLYRNIDKTKIQFDFLFHTDEHSFFEDEILELGGTIHRVSRLSFKNMLNYLNELDAFFKRYDYKIVHSHISVLSYFVLRQARKNNIPIRIAHSHEAPQSISSMRKLRIPIILMLKSLINKPVTHRFACGKDAGRWMFGKNKDFTVINNAINTKNFSFNKEKRKSLRKEFNIESDLIIGNVSRFNRQKNHMFLVEIFKYINDKKPNSKLLLIGDGELKEQIVEHAKKFNIINNIMFLGVRPDVPNMLQMFDVFVMPSLFEGLPVTLIEAQTSGLKIFASDTITREVGLTDDIEFLSLNGTAEYWANEILKTVPYERKDKTDIIKANGYDIVESTQHLQEFYLEQYKTIS